MNRNEKEQHHDAYINPSSQVDKFGQHDKQSPHKSLQEHGLARAARFRVRGASQ